MVILTIASFFTSVWSILVSIVIGALIGWVASIIMGSKGGLIKNIIVGVIGAFVGGLIGKLIPGNTGNWVGLGLAVLGAVLVIWVARKISGK